MNFINNEFNINKNSYSKISINDCFSLNFFHEKSTTLTNFIKSEEYKPIRDVLKKNKVFTYELDTKLVSTEFNSKIDINPSFLGTAVDIYLTSILSKGRYDEKIKCNISHKPKIKEIYEYTCKTIEYRSGSRPEKKEGDLIKFKKGFKLIKNHLNKQLKEFSKDKSNIVNNPDFSFLKNKRIIKADGDFIKNKILYEIKTSKETYIKNWVVQLFSYIFLNIYLNKKYEIIPNIAKVWNPLKGKIYKIEIKKEEFKRIANIANNVFDDFFTK